MNKEQIEHKLLEYGVQHYYINDNLTVDVDGDLVIWPSTKNLNGFTTNPETFKDSWSHYISSFFQSLADNGLDIKFGMVNGDFDCSRVNLRTLRNCPVWVSGDYNISHNRLGSLDGLAEYIGGDLYIQNNYLEDLNFSNSLILGEIYCWSNSKVEDVIQKWAYSSRVNSDKLGSIKGYYSILSRERKINQIING